MFSTMPAVDEKPGGGLRNTLYEQQTRSGRRLTRGRLLLYKILVPVAVSLLRLVWNWSRVVRVIGAEHIPAALGRAPSFIPVYWHQHQVFCVKHLLEQRSAGLKLGFLISPSVDGEIGAMAVRSLGGEVIRGSSSHTGARALRDYYQALAHDSVSPAITPDGPRGPACRAAPGVAQIAGLSGVPVLPVGAQTSRRRLLPTWDRMIVPLPFGRGVIVCGEPITVPRDGWEAALPAIEAALNDVADRADRLCPR